MFQLVLLARLTLLEALVLFVGSLAQAHTFSTSVHTRSGLTCSASILITQDAQ
jgi:hypothetical protein